MRKKKGFTLVELLVVIAIIALLMGILMPALARVRQVAYRMVSGTNLAGIGKAILLYANDNDGDYPVSGSRKPKWDASAPHRLDNWDDIERKVAYEYNDNINATTNMTITSCFYLLVKYADVAPKQFVNKADVSSKEFSFAEDEPRDQNGKQPDLTDVWDFGGTDVVPGNFCSYSYHFPFYGDPEGRFKKHYPVTQQSNPAKAVAGDRNPYYLATAQEGAAAPHCDDNLEDPDWDNNTFIDKDGKANATAHQQDGQSVLYNDTHVKFEKLSNCGINNDNIYVPWSKAKDDMDPDEKNGFDTLGWDAIKSAKTFGSKIGSSDAAPYDEDDAYLVNEYAED